MNYKETENEIQRDIKLNTKTENDIRWKWMIYKDREWYTKTERQRIKFKDRETENDIQRQRDREWYIKTENEA